MLSWLPSAPRRFFLSLLVGPVLHSTGKYWCLPGLRPRALLQALQTLTRCLASTAACLQMSPCPLAAAGPSSPPQGPRPQRVSSSPSLPNPHPHCPALCLPSSLSAKGAPIHPDTQARSRGAVLGPSPFLALYIQAVPKPQSP